MLSALETAAEMMRLGVNGYFLAGMQDVLIGLVYGIELIIIIEVLVNGKNSRVIKFIQRFKKSSKA
jgi:hypothetical protein